MAVNERINLTGRRLVARSNSQSSTCRINRFVHGHEGLYYKDVSWLSQEEALLEMGWLNGLYFIVLHGYSLSPRAIYLDFIEVRPSR